ncbi:ion channel [Clostridium botulinum]|uniref:ion channel n=1 Tax=Clostridium botulinum TaxID=1491 RepID=UPI0009B36CDB
MYLCWIYKNSKSKYNLLSLVFCILVIILLFAVMCSMIYYIDFPRGQDKFKLVNSDEGLLFFDFIYYSVVTFTTLGYGDIIPIS